MVVVIYYNNISSPLTTDYHSQYHSSSHMCEQRPSLYQNIAIITTIAGELLELFSKVEFFDAYIYVMVYR